MQIICSLYLFIITTNSDLIERLDKFYCKDSALISTSIIFISQLLKNINVCRYIMYLILYIKLVLFTLLVFFIIGVSIIYIK